MKNALAFIVFVILLGIGFGSFSGFLTALGLPEFGYEDLLPGGLGAAFAALTLIGGFLWYRGKRRNDD